MADFLKVTASNNWVGFTRPALLMILNETILKAAASDNLFPKLVTMARFEARQSNEVDDEAVQPN